MNRWKQIALALTVVVSILSGCSLGPGHRSPPQLATVPPPVADPFNPSHYFICCSRPEGTLGNNPCRGSSGSIKNTGFPNEYDYEIKNGWLHPRTGKYCIEEGGYVRFENGAWFKGPRSGNYFTDTEKAVCYTTKFVIPDRGCDSRPEGNVLRLTGAWFRGQCNEEKVPQSLKDSGISLEDPRWEDCDSLGLWRGINLSK